MNMQTSTVMAPPAPKRMEEMQLPVIMMRDIMMKTLFRKNCNLVSELAKAIALPIPVTQELVDIAVLYLDTRAAKPRQNVAQPGSLAHQDCN